MDFLAEDNETHVLMANFCQEYHAAGTALANDPCSVEEAFSGPEANQWHAACEAEITQLVRRRTWILVTHPLDKPVIPCRMVLHKK